MCSSSFDFKNVVSSLLSSFFQCPPPTCCFYFPDQLGLPMVIRYILYRSSPQSLPLCSWSVLLLEDCQVLLTRNHRLTLIQIDDLQALLDTLWLWSNLLHSLDDQGWPSFPCSYSRSFLIICERQQRSFFLCAGEVSRLTNSFTEKLETGSLPFFSPPCVSVYCCLFLPFTILFPAWLAHCCLLVPPRTFFSVIFISSYFSWVFPYLLPSAPSLLFPCTAHLTLSAFYWPASERLVCCCFYFSFNQLQLDRGFPTPVQLVLHAATSFQPPSCLPAFDTVSLFFGLHGTAVLIFLLILRLSFLCLLHWVLFCHSFFKYNQSFRVPCSAFFPCYPDLGMNSSNPMTYFLRTVC